MPNRHMLFLKLLTVHKTRINNLRVTLTIRRHNKISYYLIRWSNLCITHSRYYTLCCKFTHLSPFYFFLSFSFSLRLVSYLSPVGLRVFTPRQRPYVSLAYGFLHHARGHTSHWLTGFYTTPEAIQCLVGLRVFTPRQRPCTHSFKTILSGFSGEKHKKNENSSF
jgi:hypothetical protein